ncbi:MAG: acetyl-CoA synthetase, partial [Pseudonocardiales bacterium]|nr:acetyl-CoA synthetase [Pseudonocardiales bacterium]
MTDDAKLVQNADELERVLKDLQRIERFEPPAEFAAQARVRDMAVYEAAMRDPEGYWADQARGLHWDKPFSTVLDDSNPPFFKWFTDGEL